MPYLRNYGGKSIHRITTLINALQITIAVLVLLTRASTSTISNIIRRGATLVKTPANSLIITAIKVGATATLTITLRKGRVGKWIDKGRYRDIYVGLIKKAR